MRWVPMGRFGHSNPELLALYIYGDMAVFVIHKRSLEVPGGPRGVPGGSQGCARESQASPWESQGRARGPQERARGAQGRAWGSLASKGVPGRPRHPQDPFHKHDSVI